MYDYKTTITAGVLVLSGLALADVQISGELLNAIEQVESGRNCSAIGDNGKAVGCMQIWPIYVKDVNRILQKPVFSLQDRFSCEKSRRMVQIYLRHYGRAYEAATHKKATNEILARIHSGGPDGWEQKSTLKYWRKVEKELNK